MNATDGTFKVEMPDIPHLYDECEWKPFVSNDAPQPDTWDAEDRASAIKSKVLSKHVCGGDPYDAMYIDARTVSDDLPWDETGQMISKNTPG